ncbi:MAG: hypothetical protein ACLUFU_05365 [Bacilli bacterium]
MGELFSIGEEVNRFDILKSKYPNLADFYYDKETDTITYKGQTIKNVGASLDHIDSIFFQLVPDDIFTYLKNGFYRLSGLDLEKIKSMLLQETIITEEEERLLKKFVKDTYGKMSIYGNNNVLFNANPDNLYICSFTQDIKDRSQILDVAKNMPDNIAAQIINETVFSLASGQNLDDINQEESKSNTNELDRGMKLTRMNPNTPFNYVFREQSEIDAETEAKNKLGLAGFSNIVLILISVITFGMFIVVLTLGL